MVSKGIERATSRAKKNDEPIGGWQIQEVCHRLQEAQVRLDKAITQAKVVKEYPPDGIYLENEVAILIDALLGISSVNDDVMVLLFGRGASVVEKFALHTTARDDNYLRGLSNAMVASNPDLAEQVGISRPKQQE